MTQLIETNSPANQLVHDYWNANPCGAHYIQAPFGTAEFYRQYATFRYRTEWHLPLLVPFGDFQDKDVLEIGCGLGTDGTQFAQHGARYTGVDLTEAAVEATRTHFTTLNLTGRFEVQNAEKLTLPDEAFDLVYSHGVLHHTQDISRTFAEIHRVLRPNGRLILMLYHRHSFNYYVRILGYMRLRLLAYGFLRQMGMGARPGAWEAHYQNFRRMGWHYLSAQEFPHHATDGPDCPIANSYSRASITPLLAPYFDHLSFAVAHFPMRSQLPFVPQSFEQFLAQKMGWYLFIYGQKRG